jgi:hypothetical protein
MKTSCTEELDQFTAGTGAFDMGHVVNGIGNLALNGGEREAVSSKYSCGALIELE